MELTIREETWPYIDEFFRNVPEAMRKVPTFQEALEKVSRVVSKVVYVALYFSLYAINLKKYRKR
ncbi:hypothetical protein KFU94_48090 [Chloroflexi bacterium TSY]|nr:hypothetical protein [Chloroflexi bacterium TSY]